MGETARGARPSIDAGADKFLHLLSLLNRRIGRFIVIPILVRRQDVARRTGRDTPLFAAARAARTRLERVPHVTASGIADPAVAGVRMIGAERTVDFHDAASGVRRKADEYAPRRGPSRRTSPFHAFLQPTTAVAVLPHVPHVAPDHRAEDAAGDRSNERRRLEAEQSAVGM